MKEDANQRYPAWKQSNDKPELDKPMHEDSPPRGRRDSGSVWRYRSRVGDAVSRVLILWKEEECLAAQASIPRALQLSVRRSRGEAIGRILTLIGTPERFFLNREAAECSRRLVLTSCFHTSFAESKRV